jgi:hypothetical protein
VEGSMGWVAENFGPVKGVSEGRNSDGSKGKNFPRLKSGAAGTENFAPKKDGAYCGFDLHANGPAFCVTSPKTKQSAREAKRGSKARAKRRQG